MTSNADLQALLLTLAQKLGAVPDAVPAEKPPEPRAVRTKVVPVSARENPDIDPYAELSEIDTTRYKWKFCKNGRWRKIPIQSPEEVKRRTEQMLKTKLQKREENMRRLKEQIAAIEAAPADEAPSAVEEPPSKTCPSEESEDASIREDPDVARIVADHIADKMRRAERARELSSASASVFGVAVKHQ